MKQLFLSLAAMLCALCAQAQERAFLPLSGTWESSLGTCRSLPSPIGHLGKLVRHLPASGHHR